MPIKVSCQYCSTRLNAPTKAIGHTLRCPECGRGVRVTDPDDDMRLVPEGERLPWYAQSIFGSKYRKAPTSAGIGISVAIRVIVYAALLAFAVSMIQIINNPMRY